MKLIASAVTNSAARVRSPSFSRSSSSTTTTMRPARISSTASSTVAKFAFVSGIDFHLQDTPLPHQELCGLRLGYRFLGVHHLQHNRDHTHNRRQGSNEIGG